MEYCVSKTFHDWALLIQLSLLAQIAAMAAPTSSGSFRLRRD